MKMLQVFLSLIIMGYFLTAFADNCPRVDQFSCHKGPYDNIDICETNNGWYIWANVGARVVAFNYAKIFGLEVGGLMCFYKMSDNSEGIAPFDPYGYVKSTSKNWSLCFSNTANCCSNEPDTCHFERA